MKRLLFSALILCPLVAATQAIAFDPNEGAYETQAPRPTTRTLPDRVVPNRYYTQDRHVRPRQATGQATPATRPLLKVAPTPLPAPSVAAPAMLAPDPTTAQAPSAGYIAPPPNFAEAPPAPQPAPERLMPAEQPTLAPAAGGYAQPAYEPSPAYDYNHYAPAAQAIPAPYGYSVPAERKRRDRFSLGVEGFYDEYQEDSVSLTDKGWFGGVTAGYTHYFNPRWYGELGLAAAYGSTDYESISGTIDNIPQWTVENRAIAGYDMDHRGDGNHLKTYFGLSTRYFSDELKGKNAVGGLGGAGYDRRIFQIFLPIGMTYEYASGGWDFAPNLEIAPLLWGNVSSRLGTLPGFPYVENRQNSGFHIRGEFPMGRIDEHGRGWQFGPFVRYWDIPDSEVDAGFIEPENTRLQLGVGAKMLF